MTRIWYDWEFLEDGTTIEPISLGMIREIPGPEEIEVYYAVNKNAPWERISKHPWLMQNVVPKLPLRIDGTELYLNTDSEEVKSIEQIAEEAKNFILAVYNPRLTAWYAAYDHVCLMQLWGPMIDRPEGIPMWTHDLRQQAETMGMKNFPFKQNPLTEHHALHDAYHDRKIELYFEHLNDERAYELGG